MNILRNPRGRANDILFTSGTLGRYSSPLSSVLESPGQLYGGGSSP